jgi:hypothetical protein
MLLITSKILKIIFFEKYYRKKKVIYQNKNYKNYEKKDN